MTLSKQFVNSINTNLQNRQIQVDQEQKMRIVQLAIEQTYLKFKKEFGESKSRIQVEEAIKKHINTGNVKGFTRQGDARAQIEQLVSREDMLDLIIKSFVGQNYKGYNQNNLGGVLENSVNETARIYGIEHTQRALKRYITQNIDTGFTRTNGARSNLSNYQVLPETAKDLMIGTVIARNIEEIEQNKTIIKDAGMYFNADEFAKMDLPAEK